LPPTQAKICIQQHIQKKILDLGAKAMTFMADYFCIQQDITDNINENSTCHPNCKYANNKDWQVSFCVACRLLIACEFDAILLPMLNLNTVPTPITYPSCYCLTSDVVIPETKGIVAI
jgi:hypothetical protein